MAEKPILNQAAIDAANAKNAAAKLKATAAQAKITELQPKVELSQKLFDKTVSGTSLAQKIAKKTGDTSKSQGLIDKFTETGTKVKGEVLDPFAAAKAELEAASGGIVDVPEAKYADEKSTSAYDLITLELTRLGLPSLIGPLKEIFESGITGGDSLRLALSQRPEYKTRFSANDKRTAAGLSALTPAEYLQLEDQYQNIMRNYGLPASYYTKDATGKQSGFDELLGKDVSAAELEDRVMTAQQRVINANPEVLKSIKDFYGDSVTDGNILAYVLDPTKGLEDIKRKVTAAEIGGAAVQAGLNLGDTPEQRAIYAARAAELGAAGITKAQAQQGFQTVAEVAPRGGQLAAMYGESPYTQQTAEQEIFGLAGSADAARQRKKLVGLERAAFSGNAGAAQGALGRERAGNL